MSVLFIINPVAGKGKAKRFVPVIEEICKEESLEYDIRFTEGPGDGTSIAKRAVEEGFRRIISVGGDGTLNEVVNGVAGSNAALGVIPGGSGNDFARSIGTHGASMEIVRDILKGCTKSTDLGKCNGRYFINVGSAGLDAEVAYRTKEARRFFSGAAAYVIAALRTIFTYKGVQMKVTVDDRPIESKTLLMAIANGKYYGGGMLPAPDADIEDGYFDICHVRNIWRPKLFVLLPKYIKGKHGTLKEVTFMKAKRIRFEAESLMPVNLDGEIIMDRILNFEIMEKGIDIIFPQA